MRTGLIVAIVAVGLASIVFLPRDRSRLLPVHVPTASMEPAIMAGETVMIDTSAYDTVSPEIGDVVFFAWPVHPEIVLVKRCVGRPGDTVAVRGGTVFCNGAAVNEGMPARTPVEPVRSEVEATGSYGPYVVPQGSFFVAGDNVGSSRDSRHWGCVPAGLILGRVSRIDRSPYRARRGLPL